MAVAGDGFIMIYRSVASRAPPRLKFFEFLTLLQRRRIFSGEVFEEVGALVDGMDYKYRLK